MTVPDAGDLHVHAAELVGGFGLGFLRFGFAGHGSVFIGEFRFIVKFGLHLFA
ncbi:hypothetical protein [Nocardia noduli]|uniref:hypothetical protein n=1 Tax=Nocardia noduli TaxID=2815722 RepID=UPI001C21F836|nr:hypothetical protein [Nocardia noduli]